MNIGHGGHTFWDNTGTGGTLIVYSNNIKNNSQIVANGVQGIYAHVGGGASGGGSINIFYKTSYTNIGNILVNGGEKAGDYASGAGGTGSISIGQIVNGTYVSTYTNY